MKLLFVIDNSVRYCFNYMLYNDGLLHLNFISITTITK